MKVNFKVCIFTITYTLQLSAFFFFFFVSLKSTCATYQEIYGVPAHTYTKIRLLIPTEDIKYF